MKPQTQMLKDMFDALVKEGVSKEEAYHKLLTWIAVEIGLEAQLTSTLPAGIRNRFEELFDLESLKQEEYDWFGELLLETGLKGDIRFRADMDAKPSDLISLIMPHAKPSHMPIPIYLEQVGSGSILIGAFNHFKTNAILFCTETDIMFYRAALLTSFIYNLPTQILFKENDNLDISLESENWKQSGLWIPVKASKLKHV